MRSPPILFEPSAQGVQPTRQGLVIGGDLHGAPRWRPGRRAVLKRLTNDSGRSSLEATTRSSREQHHGEQPSEREASRMAAA